MDINYDEIDYQCIPMVKFFNRVGLETEFSCQGHIGDKLNSQFEIIFSISVSDRDVIVFLEKFNIQYPDHTPLIGCFKKWIRNRDGNMVSQWTYCLDSSSPIINWNDADEDLRTMKRFSE